MCAWGGEGMKEAAHFIPVGKETFTQLSSPCGGLWGREKEKQERKRRLS